MFALAFEQAGYPWLHQPAAFPGSVHPSVRTRVVGAVHLTLFAMAARPPPGLTIAAAIHKFRRLCRDTDTAIATAHVDAIDDFLLRPSTGLANIQELPLLTEQDFMASAGIPLLVARRAVCLLSTVVAELQVRSPSFVTSFPYGT